MESVILEDNNEYVIIDEINDGNNHYVYLSNKNNNKDVCVRKRIEENGKEFFIGLDNETEFIKALNLFNEKE